VHQMKLLINMKEEHSSYQQSLIAVPPLLIAVPLPHRSPT
jgi:hypothetical protein